MILWTTATKCLVRKCLGGHWMIYFICMSPSFQSNLFHPSMCIGKSSMPICSMFIGFFIFFIKCLWIWTAGFPAKLSIFKHGAQVVLDFSFHVLPTKGQPWNYDPSSLLQSPNCKGTIEQSSWSQFTLLLAASNLRSNPLVQIVYLIWW